MIGVRTDNCRTIYAHKCQHKSESFDWLPDFTWFVREIAVGMAITTLFYTLIALFLHQITRGVLVWSRLLLGFIEKLVQSENQAVAFKCSQRICEAVESDCTLLSVQQSHSEIARNLARNISSNAFDGRECKQLDMKCLLRKMLLTWNSVQNEIRRIEFNREIA